jgi:predicted dehydrogenase
MNPRLSRRRFIQSTAAAMGAAALPLRADETKKASPNERLHIGVIGVAGQGVFSWSELRKLPNTEIVALCDVHESRIGPAREAFPKASFDVDFRKLIERKGIDAIVVATPDHTHAPAALAALKTGRHVYCEKPLAHTVQEIRLMRDAASKMKRVTQMGTQIHAGNNYRRVVELIQAGAIGAVSEVHCWVPTTYGGGDRPKTAEPVPQGLDWDLWLGPAPERPFNHSAMANDRGGTYMPFNWRKWWDFGGGAVTDMACHHVDLPFWALKLGLPTKVHAKGSKPHPETAAMWMTVKYEFPARGDQPAVKLTWHDGGKKPSYLAENKIAGWSGGTLFIGDKGVLLADYGRHVLLPEKDFKDFKRPVPTIPNSIGHHQEWVEACLKEDPTATTCNFEYSGVLAETVLLGAVSYRCDEPLEWNAKEMKADNTKAAEKFIRKEYRKGWEL